MYVYYTDGDSTNQWVVSNNQGPIGPTGPQGAGAAAPATGEDITLDDGFFKNDLQLDTNRTLTGTYNGGVFGPYAIGTGVTFTINSGATFTVL